MKKKWLHVYEKYAKSRNSMLDEISSFRFKLMFICACCERLIGNYSAAVEQCNSDQKINLQEILNLLWEISDDRKSGNKKISEIKEKIELINSTYDLIDFDNNSYGVDQILDAFEGGLRYCIDGNDVIPTTVAELSLNSVWMYLKEVRQSELLEERVVLRGVSHADAALILEEVDEWSFDHSWTQREIAKQLHDLKLLSETQDIAPNFGSSFRRNALYNGLSSLDYDEFGMRQ